MSNLHQMQLNYDQMQDRIVLILFTQDWSEYRFWITRRVAVGLWKILTQLLKLDQKSDLQLTQEKEEISQKIEEEKSQRQPLAEKYASRLSRKPLGDEPALITKIMAKPGPEGRFLLHLEDSQKRSIEFGGDSKLLFALCQLIQRTVKHADWALDLKV